MKHHALAALAGAALAGAALLALATGCDGKVGQCNALIKVINAAQAKVKVRTATDASTMTQAADDVEVAAKDVAGAEVALPELKKFRDDYSQLLVAMGKTMRDAGAATTSADLGKLTASAKDLSKAAAAASKLTADINSFCQGK
ncbi:MAG: hypothetical protein EXR75_01655 [Myxococcales bacterium]|nr:hypothetical protein [Myxococcales bacterium]